jgi:hypothetical protein
VTRRRRTGNRRVSLCETLDRVLDKGAVVRGDVVITVADIELLYLDLRVFLASAETARKAEALPGGGENETSDCHDPEE